MSDKHSTTTAPTIELEDFLPYRLMVVAEAVSRSLAELYQPKYGISVAEWRVLSTLGQYQRMTAKDIGAHSKMHKTKVSRAVARLSDLGYLRRQVNALDQREAFLTLTAAGRNVYQDIAPRALDFAEELSEKFSAQERQVLDKLLTKLQLKAFEVSGLPGDHAG